MSMLVRPTSEVMEGCRLTASADTGCDVFVMGRPG